jgi:hypothetical protein
MFPGGNVSVNSADKFPLINGCYVQLFVDKKINVEAQETY